MESPDSDRLAHPRPANGSTVGVQANSRETRPDRDAATAADRTGSGDGGLRRFARRFAQAATGQPAVRQARDSGERARLLSSRRAWGRRPWARQAVLLAGFLAAGVAVTYPRVTYLAGYVSASRDSASYVWGLWWTARQVTHLHNPWFTDHMAAPAGVQLGFHTLMPLPGVLLTPVTLLFGPGVSYNLLVLAMPGLLCYAMYRLARLWLGSATGAIAAGAFFGLSSMLTQQDWYHVNIAAGALFLPLALEASVRLRRDPGVRRAVILGLVMGVAVLTDQESAVLGAIITGLALGPWLLRRLSWARLGPAALAVAVGTVIASPQIIAMLVELGVGGLSIAPHSLAVSYKQYGIGLSGMFSPSPRVADFGLDPLAGPFLHGRDNEGIPMFGSVLTALAVLGLVASWRRRSAWLLAVLWVGCAALALGTSLWIGRHQYLPLATWWHGVRVSRLMPYTWFIRIPGLESFREADRLAILGLVPAALLAGAAVDWLRQRRLARPLIAVVAALGVLEAGYSGNPHVARMPSSFPRVDSGIANDHSRSIVVDLPFGLRGGIPVYGVPFFPQALVNATQDGHPRAIAYISRVPKPTIDAVGDHAFYRDLVTVQHEVPMVCPWAAGRAQTYGCAAPAGVTPLSPIKLSPAELAAAARDATSLHVGWVIVWKRNISVQTFILTYLHRTGFSYAYRDGNVLVYRHSGERSATTARG
ncbi:MAG TPA: hypothetical protein VIV12_28865 [Streptosporangiaceae bacterium]